MSITRTLHFLFAAFFLFYLGIASSSFAHEIQENNLFIPENHYELIDLKDSFTNVSISNKNVVRVLKHNKSRITIVGKKQGKARVTLSRGGKATYRANITVNFDVPAVKMGIRRFFPAENVEVQLVNNSLILSGVVTDAEIAKRIVQIASQFIGGEKEPAHVINLMQIRTGQQVMLRVRVGEVQHGALSSIGNQGIQTGANDAFSQLGDSDLVRVLAEPSLVAISGETAEFLAGGEMAVPISVEDGEIDYKSYGVGVKFTPLVLSQNRIRLTVEQEVSELSEKGSVKIGGNSIPGIESRRAKTTVELAPGEGFMIAGLIKNDQRNNQHSATELVIAVTPYLVDPVVSSNIKLPTDHSHTPTKIEEGFRHSMGQHRHHSASGLSPQSYKNSWQKKPVTKNLYGNFGQFLE